MNIYFVLLFLLCTSQSVFSTDMTTTALPVSLETKDVNLTFEGRVREEFIYFDKLISLRDDFHDTLHFFRNKVFFGAFAEYGKQTYGDPAITAQLHMCAYNYWDHPTQYAKLSEEYVVMNKGQFRDEIKLGDDHTHFGSIPTFYQDEAWVNVDFHTLSQSAAMPLSLKFGYFPFRVGRGVSLGDYHDGSISFMGWQEKTIESNATQSPQGLLLSLEFSKSIQAELYYSKWRSYSTSPSFTREGVRSSWLSVESSNVDAKAVERGTRADRDLVAGRLLLDGAGSKMSWHLEPYAVYVNAPEQRIELAADASTQLATFGCMLEAKGSLFSLNAEFAAQYGQQIMHGIDRNEQELKRDKITGALSAVYTHILQEDSLVDAQPVSDAVNSVVWLPINRGINVPAESTLKKEDGTTLLVNSKSARNSAYPFLGLSRFRPEYTIDLRGYMAMLDAKCNVFDGRLSLGVAAALVSGDDYPYNGENNKKYRGFLPLRDQNYEGEYVRSFAVLRARTFPRPVNMADTKMYAYNHDEDCSNLRYVGIGCEWRPLKNKQEMLIAPSFFSFWQDAPPYKWNKAGTRTFGNATYDAVYAATQGVLGFTGAAATERASGHLGYETSMTFLWDIAPSCRFNIISSAFFPGQMYKDVYGMPNRNTRRIKPDGSLHCDSLGYATMFGISARLTFAF